MTGEEQGENRPCLCLCASACGMCAVFARERWVAWGHEGRRRRECEKSTTLPRCAFLPATHPYTSPAPPSCRCARHPSLFHTSGVACLAGRHGCLLGWRMGGSGGCGGVGVLERRWRAIEWHLLSWDEGQAGSWLWRLRCRRRWHEAGWVQQGWWRRQQAVDGLNGEPFAQTAWHLLEWKHPYIHTNTHTNTHSWQHTPIYASMHTNWHSVLLLLLHLVTLLDYFSPHTSGFLKAAMSSTELPFKGVFNCSLLTWTVSARHQGSFMYVANYFPCCLVPSVSTCLFRLLSSFSSGFSKPNTVNEPWSWHLQESNNYINVSCSNIPNLCLVTCHHPKRIHKWTEQEKGWGSESTLKEWGLVIYCEIRINMLITS